MLCFWRKSQDLGYCGEFSVRFIHTLRHAAQKMRPKAIPPQERRFQGKAGPATPTASTDSGLRAEKPVKAPVAQKRKKTVKEKTGTKRGKVCREHAEPPCPSEAGTSTPRGPPPPPWTSSSARSSTSLTEVHAVCSSSLSFLQPETVHPGLLLLISCITPLPPINLLWQR